MNDQEYAGFWIRIGATMIDYILLSMIILPALTLIYGSEYWVDESFVKGFWDLMFTHIFPAIACIAFWVYKSASPGKMATRLTIVDARTGGKPSTGQFIGRYLAYFVATLPLGLGIIWVGIDKRKQGWHDKLAGTVVLRNNRPEPVKFDQA